MQTIAIPKAQDHGNEIHSTVLTSETDQFITVQFVCLFHFDDLSVAHRGLKFKSPPADSHTRAPRLHEP